MQFFFTSSVPAAESEPAAPGSGDGDWHQALAGAIRDADELIDAVGLPDQFREPARRASQLFPLLVPRSYIERIRRGDPHDPLLLQVLPLGMEEIAVPGFSTDPVGDSAAKRAPGLLHKYHGRALLMTTGACAVHCRYCFRRHYPYGEEPRRMAEWEAAFEVIAGDPSLHEVILSGGDPLMLTDARLEALCGRLAGIPHVTRLRMHTRLPIVLPERVTDRLLSLLLGAGPTPIVVVHANHPRELVGSCAVALQRLVRAGITVLNQAVLLKGVNATVEAQAGLCERLVDLGAIPYYLHQLDRVAGAAHFEVAEEVGRILMRELRRRLPGYAVPRYVRETAGGEFKDLLA
jgi:EF-P beta-lysylation protein EpmB